MRRNSIYFALTLLLMPSQLTAQSDAADIFQLGRHFVVLIDDSGDMRSYSEAVREKLPDYLFESEGSGQWTGFRPDIDELSVMFFAIHRDGPPNACKEAGRRFSAAPSAIFQRADLGPVPPADPQELRNRLGPLFDLPCRWDGRFSPIITASTLSLQVAEASRPFSSMVLVVVTNDWFNHAVSPALELRQLLRNDEGKYIRDVPEAEKAAQEIFPRYRFDLPEEWARTIASPRGPLKLRAYRVEPVTPTPEALVSIPPVRLDRWAISAEAVEWRSENGGMQIAKLSNQVPSSLHWRLHDGTNSALVLNGEPIPAAWRRLDLLRCPPSVCEDMETAIAVDIGKLLQLPQLAPQDRVPEAKSAVLELVTEFVFEPTQENWFHPTTSIQQIKINLAAPESLQSSWLESSRVVDNRALTRLWRSADEAKGLSQAMALDRLWAERERRRLLFAMAVFLAAVLLITYLFRTFYARPFLPLLDWRPARPIPLDLSRAGASRLLAGTVGVVNQGAIPWFGRLFSHDEQPTRKVTLQLAPPNLGPLGFKVDTADNVCGFLESETAGEGGDRIVARVERALSHGQRVPIFIATESLRDFSAPGKEIAEQLIEVKANARIVGRDDGGAGGENEPTVPAPFQIRVMPELAAPPRITFVPKSGTLEFRKDQDLEVGHLIFESQARNRFAMPFQSNYELESFKDRLPTGSRIFRLATPSLEVRSKDKQRVPVLLACAAVENPAASQDRYAFQLLGPCSQDSKRGPHDVVLHRDSTRADAVIHVSYLGQTWDLHPIADGGVELLSAEGKVLRSSSGVLSLEGEYPFRIPPTHPIAPTLLTLAVGNSGRSGRGMVTVEVGQRLELDAEVAKNLHWRGNGPPEQIFTWFRQNELVSSGGWRFKLAVREGGATEERTLKLDGEPLERIDGGKLTADQARAVLEIRVEVVDDQGAKKSWQVDLKIRMAIERLPGLNWLCIDFGTSAIAAAVGRADGDVFHIIDLQNLEILERKSLATQDRANTELGTHFLPSWIGCDADIRRDSPTTDKRWPAGFPLHKPASLDIREPSFVSLPAPFAHLSNNKERLIFSLKQWLARLASRVRLGKPIPFEVNGNEATRDSSLPLDYLLESAIAALVECYLGRVPNLMVDQVVLTHPNTFSARHRERFHRIAARVLQSRLNITSPEHITLLSESDAVAFAYCFSKMTATEESRPRGKERILVYDFGAGTLDLTLIRVEWREDRPQPKSWAVEARLGLPLAGNHFDELLMRIVDKELRRKEVIDGKSVTYQYKAVEATFVAGSEQRDRAVIETWRELRKSKHAWDGEGRFEVVVGDPGGRGGLVTGGIQNLPEQPADAEKTALVLRYETSYLDGKEIKVPKFVLSLPAERIHQDQRLSKFVDLVTVTLVGELLTNAKLKSHQVDTVIVSGRGACWPGLLEQVARVAGKEVTLAGSFQKGQSSVELKKHSDNEPLKNVVARGAIAYQALRHQLAIPSGVLARPKLGVILGGRFLVPESQWSTGAAVDLSGCDEFRIVEIAVQNPSLEQDLRSARRHFYIDLTALPIRRQTLWADDPRLFINVKYDGENLNISLKNAFGQSVDLDHAVGDQGSPPNMPWPMGSNILEAEV